MPRLRDDPSYQAAYYANNRDRIRSVQRRWRMSLDGQRHKFGRLLRRIGITAFDWGMAWERQRGRCAGCMNALDSGPHTHMDHCHTTGRFRGLLCSSCNLALGKVRDNPETLRRLADYLEASRAED